MTQKKELTVIIPAYNDILHISRLLKSLQDAPCSEIATILIINDNDNISDLEYETLIRKYSIDTKYYRNKENVGVGATRKRGIELSQTEWISFLDQDDYVTDWYFKCFILANKYNNTKLIYSFPFKRNYRDIDTYSGFPEGEVKNRISNGGFVHIGANFYNKALFKIFNLEWLDDRMSDDLYMNTITYYLNRAFNFIYVHKKEHPYIYVWDNVNTKSITNTTQAKDIAYHLMDTYRKVKSYFDLYFSTQKDDRMCEIFIDKNTGENKIFKEIDNYLEHLRFLHLKYKFPHEFKEFTDILIADFKPSYEYVKSVLGNKYENSFIDYIARKHEVVSIYDKFHSLTLCDLLYEIYFQIPIEFDVEGIEKERKLLLKLGIK